MDQRTQFIADHLRDLLSISELCALYGIAGGGGVPNPRAESSSKSTCAP
jgi:hypothetical protein